jgi:hypothetical protein
MPRQHISPVAQLVAVHGAGTHTPFVQMLSPPHCASSRQSWTAPPAHAASQVVVTGLPPPPPPPPPPTRQQTCPAAQLVLLEQAAVETVSAGHWLASAAHEKAFIGPLQQVELGATQKSPPPPQPTAPLSIKLTGSLGSRVGSSVTLMGLPSLVPDPLAPLGLGCRLPVPVDGGAAPLPFADGAVFVSSLLESPHAEAIAAAARLEPKSRLRKKRIFFIWCTLVRDADRRRCQPWHGRAQRTRSARRMHSPAATRANGVRLRARASYVVHAERKPRHALQSTRRLIVGNRCSSEAAWRLRRRRKRHAESNNGSTS